MSICDSLFFLHLKNFQNKTKTSPLSPLTKRAPSFVMLAGERGGAGGWAELRQEGERQGQGHRPRDARPRAPAPRVLRSTLHVSGPLASKGKEETTPGRSVGSLHMGKDRCPTPAGRKSSKNSVIPPAFWKVNF